ncbi:transposase [Massilia sp. CCM 8692]|uniref:Transposase n=1 Tax=Massilia rubra TaxID=2607910 RepID=A0ABX0LTH9_9BURK|nr:transposase [Massilia rubra]
MTEAKKRKVHSEDFKAKVGLEAVRDVKTVNEIAQLHGVAGSILLRGVGSNGGAGQPRVYVAIR